MSNEDKKSVFDLSMEATYNLNKLMISIADCAQSAIDKENIPSRAFIKSLRFLANKKEGKTSEANDRGSFNLTEDETYFLAGLMDIISSFVQMKIDKEAIPIEAVADALRLLADELEVVHSQGEIVFEEEDDDPLPTLH